ncbi:hypothetical protein SAMD00023353_0103820 [Rosellinia necatrix]|uniref:Uncharacterized protein n=1 Tax=Rosellinia necatrix TaxID=77044 RepID=A0A1S8A4R5_ROSNE|nr:hypothetical protein SAMD00023353_0103820 [Rosellinia necatrix]
MRPENDGNVQIHGELSTDADELTLTTRPREAMRRSAKAWTARSGAQRLTSCTRRAAASLAHT